MKVRNLEKTYRVKGGENVEALKGVSFDLPDTGLIFILGKSGSGKSTLLNLLGGLDSADGGEILVGGKNVAAMSGKELDAYRNAYCGFVFQEYNLIPELSVRDNILLSLELKEGKQTDGNVSKTLDKVGLRGYADRKVTELSGGQRQRIAIARAIIKSPEIIFADEPTGALDAKTGREILELLKGLSRERLVVAVTHDRELAEEYGDRIIELADGGIISDSQEKYSRETETPIEFTKPRLPVKTALKVGCSNFKYHPLRLAVTLLLSVIAFTLLGVSLSAAFNGYNTVAYNTMKRHGYDHSAVAKYDGENARLPIKESERQALGAATVGVADYLIDFGAEPDFAYYAYTHRFIACLSEQAAQGLGFSVDGELPRSDSEIGLTAYTAEVLAHLGKLPSQGDILGSAVEINGKSYTLSCVVDTRFDSRKYDRLKTLPKDNPAAVNLKNYLDGTAHGAVFVNDIEKFTGDGIRIAWGAKLVFGDTNTFRINEIGKLNGEGAYLPVSYLSDILYASACDKEYGGAVYKNYGSLLYALSGGAAATPQSYLAAYNEYKEEYSFPQTFTAELSDGYTGFKCEVTFNGVYDGEIPLIGGASFEHIYGAIGGEYSQVIAAVDGADSGFINADGQFRFFNPVMDKVNGSADTVEAVKSFTGGFSIVMGLFAALLLMNFISVSVSDKSLTVGVLKAMGCGNAGFVKIFAFESAIIGGASFALSSAAAFAVCAGVGGTITGALGGLALLEFNALVLPVLFAVCAAFSALGCLLPLLHLARLTPVKCIAKI